MARRHIMWNHGSWWKYLRPETVRLPYGDKVTKWLFWLMWEPMEGDE